MRIIRIALFVVLVAVLVGCSRSGPSAKVRGTITYKGQTVKAGDVYFKFEEGVEYNTAIKQDGSYQFIDLPTGNAKVLIETETFNPDQKPKQYSQQGKLMAKGMAKGLSEYDATVGKGEKARAEKGAAAPAGLTKEQKEELSKVFVKLPRKYAAEKTTPLTITVASGSQTKDFDLTD